MNVTKLTVTGSRKIPSVQFGNCDINATIEIEIDDGDNLKDVAEYATELVNISLADQKDELDKLDKKAFELKI